MRGAVKQTLREGNRDRAKRFYAVGLDKQALQSFNPC